MNPAIENALISTANEVLETMFFTAPDAVTDEAVPVAADCVSAELHFNGVIEGRLAVWVPQHCARELARDFLGEPELTDSQPGEVVRELANILCGAMLTQLHPQEQFNLSSPESCREQSLEANRAGLHKAFELNGSMLWVSVECEHGD